MPRRPEVELAGLDGQHLDLPSEQFDAVLSTWTLCTIPDLAPRSPRYAESSSLVAHSISSSTVTPPTPTSRWQERLEPLNKRLAGGCHLTRTIADDIEHAGFTIEHLDNYYAKGAPKPWGYTFEGRALKS